MNSLSWRYATKKFDSSKKIDEESLRILREATRMAPSSFGLQPFKVIQISDNELRTQLRSVSYDQSQIEECSHLFVFCVKTNLSQVHVNEYMSLISSTRDLPLDSLASFKSSISEYINNTKQEDIINWATKQAYIALGFLLMACAENKIDACPMEGFEQEKYTSLLKLSEQNLKPVVAAATGFRSQDDNNQYLKKVRAGEQNFFIEI